MNSSTTTPQTLADAWAAGPNALYELADHLWAEREKLRAENGRLRQESARYEAEIARLRDCRDKAASLMHLANQAMYGLAD